MTFEDYIENKYGTKIDLSAIEMFNPDKPKGLVYKVPVLSGRKLYNEQIRLDNMATQIRVTGAKTNFVPKFPDRKPARKVEVRVVK